MRFSNLVVTLSLALAATVQAAPIDAPDDTMAALHDKSLIERIGEVGSKVESKASEFVVSAFAFLGVPYRRGGSAAETGFDCSGLVRAIYEQTAGMILPRKASEQAAATQKIDKDELKPGDLVFFNTMRRAFSHVGIYVGNGKFIHAPKPGAEVRVDDMAMNYWKRRFDGARRVSGADAAAAAAAASNGANGVGNNP